jgi:hypothetical protein
MSCQNAVPAGQNNVGTLFIYTQQNQILWKTMQNKAFQCQEFAIERRNTGQETPATGQNIKTIILNYREGFQRPPINHGNLKCYIHIQIDGVPPGYRRHEWFKIESPEK